MGEVIGPFWTAPKEAKIKKYLDGVFWRFTAAISIIIIGSIALVFVGVWAPQNWLINTIYNPENGLLYAICVGCFFWPLAVRLSQVLTSTSKLQFKLKAPRRGEGFYDFNLVGAYQSLPTLSRFKKVKNGKQFRTP